MSRDRTIVALVAAFMLLAVVSPVAAHHRPGHAGGPRPSESPTPTPEPTPEPSPTPEAYPPPATEGVLGSFGVRCQFSHRAQVDPIVDPGAVSGHLHDFFGNTITSSDPDYQRMLTAGSTCTVPEDTAAYWHPTLIDPDGNHVDPLRYFVYYANRPYFYGTVHPFPADFKMVAGGEGRGLFPERVWWNCSEGQNNKQSTIPHCPDAPLEARLHFPNCWDGVSLDSADHRSHVVYPSGNHETSCPPSHPVKLPRLRIGFKWPPGSGGPGWELSDGAQLVHADFWNTWNQQEYLRLHDECTALPFYCGLQGTN